MRKIILFETHIYSSFMDGARTRGSRNQEKNGGIGSGSIGCGTGAAIRKRLWYISWKQRTQ